MKKPHLEEVNALKRELEESRKIFVKEHREKELLLTKMEEHNSQAEQQEKTYQQMCTLHSRYLLILHLYRYINFPAKQIQNLKREKAEKIASIEGGSDCLIILKNVKWLRYVWCVN